MSGSGVKRKRVVLSIGTKLQIVERAENGESIASLSSEFNIGTQTVRDILRKKDELHKFVTSSDSVNGTSVRKTTKGSKFEDLDRAVFEWFKQKRAEGFPVSGPVLLEKAKFFHAEMKIPEPFAASQGWLQCFKSRHGIRLQGETVNTDSLRVTEFKQLVEVHNLSPEQMYNADETRLHWKALPASVSKERVKLLACANAAGSHKLKLAIIGNQQESFPETLSVHYYQQSETRMTRDNMKDWFYKHFVPSVRDHLRSKNIPEKAVLLLDSVSSHPSDVLKTNDGQIFVAFLPPNVTSPNQGVFETFKRRYRKALLRSVPEEGGDLGEFRDKWTIKDAISACSESWDDVPSLTFRKSWRKLFPDVMDGSEEGESEEITAASLLEEIRNKNGFEGVDRENVEEWLMSESEEDEREESPGKKVSVEEALSCAETLIEFLERETDSNPGDIRTLRKIRNWIELKGSNSTI